MNFETAFAELPLIAILRGLPATEAMAVGEALVTTGFRILEVPLNNETEALQSIEALASALAEHTVIGAGTVTSAAQVQRVQDAGGTIIVSPDTNQAVIEATRSASMTSCPGVATPTEALTALRFGAQVLKLFPASLHGAAGLNAIQTILPSETRVVAVGGITSESVPEWRKSHAAGLGINTALYSPQRTIDDLATRAKAFIRPGTHRIARLELSSMTRMLP